MQWCSSGRIYNDNVIRIQTKSPTSTYSADASADGAGWGFGGCCSRGGCTGLSVFPGVIWWVISLPDDCDTTVVTLTSTEPVTGGPAISDSYTQRIIISDQSIQFYHITCLT